MSSAQDEIDKGNNIVKSTLLSERHVRRLRKEFDISLPKKKNEARQRNESDPRNFHCYNACLRGVAKNIPNPNLWNGDATQGEVNPSNRHKNVVVLKKEDQKLYNFPSVPAATISPSVLATFIKYILIHSAVGKAGPPVFMVQCPGLKDEDFHVSEVPELMLGTNGPPGYICMCKTRAGNAKFYTWYFETVVIPCLVEHRKLSRTEEFPILFSMDGEQKVLDAVFNGLTEASTRIIAKLNAERIYVIKVPASSSGVLQAADVGPIFKYLKAALSRIVANPNWLELYPLYVLDACKLAVKSIELIPGFIKPARDFTTAMTRLAQGVFLFWACLQTCLTPLNVARGFIWSAQNKDKKGVFDYRKMMTKCRSVEYSLDDFEKWKASVDYHADLIVLNGNLAESAMTDCGLPKTQNDTNSLPHDERYIYKQRAVWLNHPRTLAFIKAQNTPGYLWADVAAVHPYVFPNAVPPVNPAIMPVNMLPVAQGLHPARDTTTRKRGGANTDRTPQQQAAYERKLLANKERKRAKKLALVQQTQEEQPIIEDTEDHGDENNYNIDE